MYNTLISRRKNNFMKTKILLAFILAFQTITFNMSTVQADNADTVARFVYVVDVDNGFVLHDKRSTERLYPASTTKVMTAILALEYCERVGMKPHELNVVITAEAVDTLPVEASNIGLRAGEVITMDEALYAIMLASANEVANAIALTVGGSVEVFAEMMTERAAALGTTDTNFTNPTGLHHPNHYSTAQDLALIKKHAIQNEHYLRYISTLENEVLTRPIRNTNRTIFEQHPLGGDYYYPYVIGGKTGFTDEAGHSLVVYAERDGVRLVSVVMFSERFIVFIDTSSVLDYSFGLYEEFTIPFESHNVPVYDSDTTQPIAFIPITWEQRGFRLPRTLYEEHGIDTVFMYDRLVEPIQAGDKAGNVTFMIAGIPLGTAEIYTAEEFISPIIYETQEFLLQHTDNINETVHETTYTPLYTPPIIPSTYDSEISSIYNEVLVITTVVVIVVLTLLFMLISGFSKRRKSKRNKKIPLSLGKFKKGEYVPGKQVRYWEK
jgi:D-alanyl-D-alanine carboxypeptidase